MKEEQWIDCRVYPGMFSDERAVEVRGRSFFVHQRSVRQTEGETGQVRVTIIEDGGHRWAVMPTGMRESIELGA